MKCYFLVFFLCLISLQFSLVAQENSNNNAVLKPLIEDPLPLSKNLPINLSQENRKNYLRNPQRSQREAEQNIAFIKNKSLPWLSFTSALATILVILYVRMLPTKETKEQIDPLAKAKMLVEIKDNLQKLVMRKPKDEHEAKTSIMQMDSLLRMFLSNQFGLPAFVYTAPELQDHLGEGIELDASLKEGMKNIFSIADKLKFAKEKVSPEEYIEIVSRMQVT